MPRITVDVFCTATVREQWVLDVTDDQLAELQLTPSLGLDLVSGGGTYVNVENIEVTDEREREFAAFEVVAPDFTNAQPTVGL